MKNKFFASISILIILLLTLSLAFAQELELENQNESLANSINNKNTMDNYGDIDLFILDEERAGNLYLNSEIIQINSKVYGDLFAISKVIQINGLVRDDLNAIATTFELKGTGGNDVRIISKTTVVDGVIFGEFMNMGRYVTLSNTSIIAGPVNIDARKVIIDGHIQNDLNVNAQYVVLNGIVDGNAVIKATKFELGPNAQILGDLSSTRSINETSSQVGGIVTKLDSKDNVENFTSITLEKLGLLIMFFLIGAILVLISRKFTEKTTKVMYRKFLLSMLIGFLLMILAPVIGFMLLVTVVGIPIALLIVMIYIILMIISLGLTALFLGRLNIKMARGKSNLWIELLIGSIVLALVSIIPVIFILVLIFLGFVAIGGFALVVLGKDKEHKVQIVDVKSQKTIKPRRKR